MTINPLMRHLTRDTSTAIGIGHKKSLFDGASHIRTALSSRVYTVCLATSFVMALAIVLWVNRNQHTSSKQELQHLETRRILARKPRPSAVVDRDAHNALRSFVEQSMPRVREQLGHRASAMTAVIQIGACDLEFEKSNDPVQKLLLREDVCAVLVEPAPASFERLAANIPKKLNVTIAAGELEHARVQPINAAFCADKSATSADFFAVNDQFRSDHPHEEHFRLYQLGSFKESNIRALGVDAKYIDTISVACVSLDDIFQNVLPRACGRPLGRLVDVLVVDAEGIDGEVVRRFLDEYRARAIVFEMSHMGWNSGNATLKMLNETGYDRTSKGYNDMYEWYGNGQHEAEALWNLIE